MKIPPKTALAQVRAELAEAQGIIQTLGWRLDESELESKLTLRAHFTSPIDQEEYLFEFGFSDYPAMPPKIDMIDVHSGIRNATSAFPQSSDSLFHSNDLICAPFNRCAYKAHGGPHGDWTLANWQTATRGVSAVGDMLGFLGQRLSSPEKYRGRKK